MSCTEEPTSASKCRLCTKTECDLEPIFGEKQSTPNLAKIIHDNVSLTITENDPFPKMICTSCKHKIEEFNTFRQACIWSADYFKSTLKEKRSSMFEPECCLNEVENSCCMSEDKVGVVVPKCEKTDSDDDDMNVDNDDMNVDNDEILENIASVTVSSQSNEVPVMNISKCEESETVLKDPLPDDYILVRQETFSVPDMDESSSQNAVEFCKPTIFSSDKVIVNDMWKKREILPQMWDVYEKKTEENMLIVTRRRYLISKAAFPCSLCSTCVSVKCEKLEVEEEAKKEYNFEIDDVETEDSSEPLVCKFCLKSFPRKASLRRHVQSHYDFKSLPCKLCGRGFSRKEHLARHMLLHTGSRPYSCDLCSKTFTRKEHLTRHQAIYHEKPRSWMKSSGSDQEIIKTNGSVAIDKAGEASSDDMKPAKPYTCKECGTGFGRKEHLLRHHQRAHNQVKVQEAIAAPLDLHNDDGRPYICKLCSRTFTRKEHLLRHHKVHVRDNMFVNESQFAETDISHAFNNTVSGRSNLAW